ncbi:hypothetical protein C2S53_000330 [Perilla frutescens var. hirtella]|uniref:DUF4378 domain-containing protein n=1 Tax=Perilla frutescens var. hirtella TaxID=608512 RepID=A0AAD4JA56_PERFH|nr:hypothetical protein C2S53_000330 [Perilla frutescens var. hirtella]
MAKRSQKRILRHERGQAGCIWGLISIFDFRHGRSTKRLLSDRSRANKLVVGGGYSSNPTVVLDPTEKCESLVDAEESMMPMPDVAKTSVKELMEEEMYNEKGSENRNDPGTGLEPSNSNNGNHPKKHQKKRSRSRIKSSDLDVSELGAAEQLMPENCNQVPEQRLLDNLDLEMIMEELVHINQRNDLHGDLDIPSDQAVTVVEEKLVAAVTLLTEQRMSSKRFGEDGNHCCSKEFMDALKTLSLNKGLLLKLLQDPNSKLVKQVQNLENSRLGRDQIPNLLSASNSSEDKQGNLKNDESSSRKQRNFFRRRTKSLESSPLGGDKDFQAHNKIVVLKPGQSGAQSPQTDARVSSLRLQSPNMDDRVHTNRNTSQFSFTEIKRKLRHAIGKERQGISPDRLNLKYSPKHQNSNNGDKGSSAEPFGWSSPNRNHFYTERFLTSSPSFKKGEPVGKLKDSGSVAVNDPSQYSRLGGPNIYVEAKKHLSEMLKNGGENPESVTRQLPKSLGRILSLPEYNGTPCCSPRKYGDDIFITTQIRLSPRGIVNNDLSGLLQENHNNNPSPRKQHLESQPGISSSNSEDKIQSMDMNDNISLRDDQEHFIEIESVMEDTLVPQVQSSPAVVAVIEETTESKPQEEAQIITISSESSSDLIGGDINEEDTGEVDNTQVSSHLLKNSSPCFRLPSSCEDQLLSSPAESPPRCPVSCEIEDSDCVIDKMERPSPISVLEPLFTDDDVSPASTMSQPVEKEIQPRHIHFEEQSSASDQGICTRISLEDEESAFEYVEAVLLGSGLNWDEFLVRWISMYEILDSSLFDEVELFSSRPRHDQKLLFDCANEALQEVCGIYFGCFSGIPQVKMNIKPAPKGMDLIQEIWQRVEWHLFQLPQPHSLDQLVKSDLARSRKWMNLQSDIELIVSEMGETIFTELVDETVLSFADDTLECKFAVLQTEPYVVEAANL